MTDVSMPPLAPWIFPVLFLTGLLAGFVDSIAGGGGLITLPVWLAVGIPPQIALGTNKLQATFGSLSAARHYANAKLVAPGQCIRGIVFTAAGAAVGTLVVQQLNPIFLKRFIPILLLAIIIYFTLRPQLGEKDIHPRMAEKPFYLAAGLSLGFYDGFLGPGAGSFWTVALMLGLGFNLTKATGYTKVMNVASNVSSLIFFGAAGKVLYGAGLTMGIGQLIGARIGSGMVVARGTKFIRPIFISMVLAITLKLLYDVYRR
jgi:uncharacterized membrane protein YfcA